MFVAFAVSAYTFTGNDRVEIELRCPILIYLFELIDLEKRRTKRTIYTRLHSDDGVHLNSFFF